MDSFIGIRFKKKTAKRFQEFSKINFQSHTEALETMVDFFIYNQISPRERLGPTGKTLEASINKRINAVIAIMKDIEKTQTKPTTAILQALLEQAEPVKKPLILEKKVIEEMNRLQQNQNKETRDLHK